MEQIKKIVITFVVLLVIGVLIVVLINLKNNITANNYKDYWWDEALGAGSYHLIIMGDSTGLGVGASKPQYSYAGILKDELRKRVGRAIKVINLSSNNATIASVVDEQLPRLEEYEIDLLVVSIGLKDVDNASLDISTLDRLFSKLPIGKSYFLEIPASFNPHRDEIIQLFNSHIQESAEKFGIDVIPLYSATNNLKYDWTYHDWDFIHPSDKGYKVWSDTILNQL